MTGRVRCSAFVEDVARLYQPGLFQQPRRKTQSTLVIETCIYQPKRVSIDPQAHHVDAFTKARCTAKVVGDLGVNTVGCQCREVKALSQLQRRNNAGQAPKGCKTHDQGGPAGPKKCR